MPEQEVPNFFNMPGSDAPNEPAVEEAKPEVPPAAAAAAPTAPPAAPAYGQDAVERMAQMAEAQRQREAFNAHQQQASQAWDSLLRPQERSLSKEDKERLLTDPEALVDFITAERQQNSRVAQALFGALVNSRQEAQYAAQAASAYSTHATLRAIETTNVVADKLAAEGYGPQEIQTMIFEADQALQQDPGKYLNHRTDSAGFEAAVRYVGAHKNLRPSGSPSATVARFGRTSYTPSAPTPSSGERQPFGREAIESVERALGRKLSPSALQRASAMKVGA